MSLSSNPPEDLSPVEINLGKVLALIHRVLPRLDDTSRRMEVGAALQQAVSLLQSARNSYAGAPGGQGPLGVQNVATGVAPPIVAVIAAAVSVVLDRPYRLVSVQQVSVPVVPHLNVWAVEGRTQIFMSHKVR